MKRMTANKTCGNCDRATKYEGSDATDPWLYLPPGMRERARHGFCICALDGEPPQAFPLDQRPEDVPCDFWEG